MTACIHEITMFLHFQFLLSSTREEEVDDDDDEEGDCAKAHLMARLATPKEATDAKIATEP